MRAVPRLRLSISAACAAATLLPWTVTPAYPQEPDLPPGFGHQASAGQLTNVDMTGPYGVYHAIYDDFQWFAEHGDPGFLYTPTMARLVGLLALRLAESEILQFDYSDYGRKILDYVDGLEKENLDEDGHPQLGLETAELKRLATAIRDTAAWLEARIERALRGPGLSPETARALNDLLMGVERAFLAEEGLPGRAWYKHTIYAPGLYTGYAALPLPGPAQVIRDGNPAGLDEELAKLRKALEAAWAKLVEASEAF